MFKPKANRNGAMCDLNQAIIHIETVFLVFSPEFTDSIGIPFSNILGASALLNRL